MKFQATLKELRQAAEQAAVTVGGAAANLQEVLKNYLLTVENGTFLLLGTDLEISMLARKTATIVTPGRTLIDAKKFNDILRYAHGDSLDFELMEGKLHIKSRTGKWALLARDADDFPVVEDFKDAEKYFKLNRKNFIGSVRMVNHSVCEDETRKQLTVCALVNNRMLSANGKMASSYELTGVSTEDLPTFFFPQRALAPLVRVLGGFEEDTFNIQDGKAFYYFKISSNVFSIRKTTVEFPYKKTIDLIEASSKNPLEVKVNRQSLIGAIERVRLNSSEDSKAIHIEISPLSMLLRSKDESGNYAVDSLPCIRTEAEPKDIKCFFNWMNILDSIKSLNNETVTLKFSEQAHKAPLFLQEPNFASIVLPIQQAFQYEDIAP